MPALPLPSRRPRMIATDLDGTIIGYRHTRSGRLSPRTIAALRDAHDAGVEVVFVTGRPLRWLGPLSAQLGPVGPVICSNGAVLVDTATDDVLIAHPMPVEAVWTATDRLRALDRTVSFGAETLEGFFWEHAFSERAEFRAEVHAAATLEAALPGRLGVVKRLFTVERGALVGGGSCGVGVSA
ncbi:Cof-type HAD-IIB family hydrolase [Micrococcus luteus]|nr:Cof-type HAD-IIB family hydrolase [Micrococcus luteus]